MFNRLVKKLMNMGPARSRRSWPRASSASTRKAADARQRISAKQPYLVGKELTLADFSVAAPLFYAKDCASMPLAPYANLQAWFGRVLAAFCRRGSRARRSIHRRGRVSFCDIAIEKGGFWSALFRC